MALQSQHFRGIPQLEAAAVSDAAHVTIGARGSHVTKLQEALNALEGARLDPDGKYGPATAAAVLAFKRRRNILGTGQRTPDSIVGRQTMAALDLEMFQREGNQPPTPPNPIPPPPPPPPPTPAGANFGIRAEGETTDSIPVQSVLPPTLFEVIDTVNRRAALYRFNFPGGNPIEGLFPFERAFRRFNTNQFFTVESLNFPASYSTTIIIDEDGRQTFLSFMTINFSPASAFPRSQPMFVHASLDLQVQTRPSRTTISRDGRLEFRRLLPFPSRT